jgi:hypothetical protein
MHPVPLVFFIAYFAKKEGGLVHKKKTARLLPPTAALFRGYLCFIIIFFENQTTFP